jgi:hypothetical protein
MTDLNFPVISTLGEIFSIKEISPSRLAGQALCRRNDSNYEFSVIASLSPKFWVNSRNDSNNQFSVIHKKYKI